MGDANPIRTLKDYSKPSHEGYRNTIELPVWNNVYCMENPEQAFVEYASSRTDEEGESLELGKTSQHLSKEKYLQRWKTPGYSLYPANRTKSYPVEIVKDLEVLIGKLKLLNDFYVIDMKKDPETLLLVGRRFLAISNAVINCIKSKIAVEEGITRLVFEEIARDAEINPFKNVIVFRRMIEFLGALPIYLKRNMWESKDLIWNLINWDKPPKDGDGAWHAKIKIIDPDGEEFTKTLQSIPTTRKLSERENPREIINLDHFYDT
nr:hypothetical protein [Tanacetum cinerariifolium]